MAWTVELVEGSEPAIPLFYSATGWAMLEKGLIPFDPELKEWWGGQLENELVRSEYGKRSMPLKLQGSWSSVDELIDAVNALQKRFLDARRFRKDGWGDEVFLSLTPHNATYGVRFPVSSGVIAKDDLMNACGLIMSGGHREAKTLVEVGVTVVCGDPFWESTETYTLDNYIDNPGFWRGAVAPGDSWTEVDPAAALTLAWNTDIWARMERSPQWTIAPDGVNDVGIVSDNIVVSPASAYYFQCRGYRTAGCDRITAYVWDIPGAAIILNTTWYFDAAAPVGEWVTLGGPFLTPPACGGIRIYMVRQSGDSTAGNKMFYCDAFYLAPGTNAPTGWCSGRNLVNCLDDTADNINVLCVAEIPGEVDAEIKATVELADETRYLRVAKRTRDTPPDFIWELNADTAYTTADAHYGLTDATCIDSLKENDATSPVAHRISVTFAGDPTMQQRCYWDITSNLISYYGAFVVFVVARVTGTTDTINMEIRFSEDPLWNEIGGTIEQRIAATNWTLHDGWEVFSFRIGTHDNDLFGTGNNCRLMLYAENNGTTDDLYIAGAYWVPIDEGLLIAGSDGGTFAGGSSQMIIKDMDGDRGVFGYGTVSDTYYANLGSVGGYPLLEPKVENWWYFVTTGNDDLWVFNDAYSVAVQYRPRGIFLRGSNP